MLRRSRATSAYGNGSSFDAVALNSRWPISFRNQARAELVSMVFDGRATIAHISNTATTRGSSELKMPVAAVDARCQTSDSPPESAVRNDTKASDATCSSVKALIRIGVS